MRRIGGQEMRETPARGGRGLEPAIAPAAVEIEPAQCVRSDDGGSRPCLISMIPPPHAQQAHAAPDRESSAMRLLPRLRPRAGCRAGRRNCSRQYRRQRPGRPCRTGCNRNAPRRRVMTPGRTGFSPSLTKACKTWDSMGRRLPALAIMRPEFSYGDRHADLAPR